MKPGVLLTQENADRIGEVIQDYLIRKRAELKSAGNKAAAGKSPKEFS